MDQLKSLFGVDWIQRKSAVRHLAISAARTYRILLWKDDVQIVPGILSHMQDYIVQRMC